MSGRRAALAVLGAFGAVALCGLLIAGCGDSSRHHPVGPAPGTLDASTWDDATFH